MRRILALPFFLALALCLLAQADPSPTRPHRDWHACLDHPSHSAAARAACPPFPPHRSTLPSVPASYPVRVSADNRFILYVNGQRVGDGPARGDLTHWRYELFDLAPYLQVRSELHHRNCLEFRRLRTHRPNERPHRLSARIARLPAADSISTPNGWLVEEEPGQRPLDRTSVTQQTYFASGPGEEIDAAHYDWNWNSPAAPARAWVPAASPMRDSIFAGVNHAHSAAVTGDNPWGLIPDSLPHMEYSPTTSAGRPSRRPTSPRATRLRIFPDRPAIAPPGSRTLHLLLDRKTLTTAYPALTVSGGKGAHIVLTYSEALYDKNKQKGDRDASTTPTPRHEAPAQALGLTRQLPARRRRASHLHASLVAHLALSRSRHHHRLRSAHPRLPHRQLHRLPI